MCFIFSLTECPCRLLFSSIGIGVGMIHDHVAAEMHTMLPSDPSLKKK
jgi:hypothetical protein